VAFAEVVQQVLELGIDNNGIRIGMVEDIRDIVGFESVIDSYGLVSMWGFYASYIGGPVSYQH
jgi:hypothetical protein